MKKTLLPIFIGLILFLAITPNTYAYYNFSDSFTNTNSTALTSHNPTYAIHDSGGSAPTISSNEVTIAAAHWVAKKPVSLTTIEVCADSTNALEHLGFSTANGDVYGQATGSSGSGTPVLAINGTGYPAGSSYNNAGTHTYCIRYDGSTVYFKRDGSTIVSQSLSNQGEITRILFGGHNYTANGWTNPVANIDNLSIQELAYSFTDSFTNTNNTALTSHNATYAIHDNGAGQLPYISSNQVSITAEHWVAKKPVSLTTIEVCADSTNALEHLGFSTANGDVYGQATGSSGSGTPVLAINGTGYPAGSSYNNAGTHTYCVTYNGATVTFSRDSSTIVSQSLSDQGEITRILFGGHNYTNYGWTNPVANVDNLSISN